MTDYYLTEKVQQLIKNAEAICKGPLQPVDLFLGAALVKKGTLLEMFLLIEEEMHGLLSGRAGTEETAVPHKDFSIGISPSTEILWNRSLEIMTRYDQIYLNEGHIIKAFYQTWTEEERALMSSLPHERIQESVTTARDLIVSMNVYQKKEMTNRELTILRAAKTDEERVLEFTAAEFGEPWVKTLKYGFKQQEIPIFLAWKDSNLVGFSSYDVYRRQKGIYGPMGVVKNERKTGAGSMLLHAALQDMKDKGYAYIILGEAGPIEYYEKECGAVVVPKNSY
ncbi:GNAT family N-acetyltransferase [Bacillus sp. AK031]